MSNFYLPFFNFFLKKEESSSVDTRYSSKNHFRGKMEMLMKRHTHQNFREREREQRSFSGDPGL